MRFVRPRRRARPDQPQRAHSSPCLVVPPSTSQRGCAPALAAAPAVRVLNVGGVQRDCSIPIGALLGASKHAPEWCASPVPPSAGWAQHRHRQPGARRASCSGYSRLHLDKGTSGLRHRLESLAPSASSSPCWHPFLSRPGSARHVVGRRAHWFGWPAAPDSPTATARPHPYKQTSVRGTVVGADRAAHAPVHAVPLTPVRKPLLGRRTVGGRPRPSNQPLTSQPRPRLT